MNQFMILSANAPASDTTPNTIKDNAAKSASLGMIVDTYCTRVLREPKIILPSSLKNDPLVSEAPSFLVTAKDNATDYRSNIAPRIITLISNLKDYSNMMIAYQESINESWESWKGGNLQGKEDLVALLEWVQTATNEKKLQALGTKDALSTFSGKLNTDVSNFNTTYHNAEIIIMGTEGDNGLLKQFETQIDDLNTQITHMSLAVTASGLAVIGGAFVALTGVLTFGTTFVVGSAIFLAGAGGLVASSLALSNLLEARGNAQQEFDSLNSNLTFLRSLKSSSQELAIEAANAESAVSTMANDWQQLGNELGNIITAIKPLTSVSDLPPARIAKAPLNQLAASWEDVSETLPTIEDQMRGVKTVDLRDSKGKLKPFKRKDVEAALEAA
ncbi:MAG: HBL/NHE enterotoxin family protein [Bacteroidota bacterium]